VGSGGGGVGDHRDGVRSAVVHQGIAAPDAQCGHRLRHPADRFARLPAPVVLIVMENHSYGQIAGSASAPYLNRFAHRGTLFTDMNAVSHPSLPNYLALTSGSTLGCTSDKCPTRSFRAKNIFEQLSAHRRSWRSWEESMPGRCVRSNAGLYAVRHNPAAYYTDLFPWACPKFDVPYPKSLPRRLHGLTFITPNICHDTHDCSVAVGDTWLRRHVPKLLKGGPSW
jgi:hypothetical protein